MDEIYEVNEAQTPLVYDDTIVGIAENAEKRIAAVNKIKLIALKVTNINDWVDQNGKPYLQVSGAEKIARLFGISWTVEQLDKDIAGDGHVTFNYKGLFRMGNASVEAIGARSSRDLFFSVRYINGNKIERPPTEIDMADVKKAAYTNCLGNGITRLLGIRNMTWEELNVSGIKKDGASKVSYTQAEMSEKTLTHKDEIIKMLDEMCKGDSELIKKGLKKITTFQGKDGATVDGADDIEKLSEKRIEVTYGKLKKEYDTWKEKQENG